MDVQPKEVDVQVLNKAGIQFTLVGAYGIAGWLLEPRASQDVDILIHAQHKKRSRQSARPSPTSRSRVHPYRQHFSILRRSCP